MVGGVVMTVVDVVVVFAGNGMVDDVASKN